jgi:hypothetical protein
MNDMRFPKCYKVLKKISGVPYEVGDLIPLYKSVQGGLVWHVWTRMVDVPNDCVKELEPC